MTEPQKKAFDFVADYTKQLIALATGIITFTVTFLQNESLVNSQLLIISWGLFTLSIIAGIWRLMSLTGNLDSIKGSAKLTITTMNVRFPGMLQIGSFLIALILSIIFGTLQIPSTAKKPAAPTVIILQQSPIASGKSIGYDTIYPINKKQMP